MTARDDLRAALDLWDGFEEAEPGNALADAARALLAEESPADCRQTGGDTAAVEAVLALHRPLVGNRPDYCAYDETCDYPCPTVRAITAARAGQGPSPAEAAVKRVEALCDDHDQHNAETSIGSRPDWTVRVAQVRYALAGEASS